MKYFAKKVKTPHGVFDSQTEYEQYLRLKYQEDIGVISDLKQQVRFEIIPKLIKKVAVQLKTKTKYVDKVEEKAAHYTCDFTYINQNGQMVILEIKSKATAMARDYSLRKKLIKQLIQKHNQEVGFEDWVFEEIVDNGKKARKSKSKVH